jgi:multiple sugar transport system ATP-binding protein
MIAGLETVSSGTVAIGARDVTDLRPGLRNCSMVFQNYALYPHMTIRNNIAYGMRVRGAPRAEIDAAVRDAARILEIESYLDRRPKDLSGGQRQRVAIGRAIVRHPEVFLFDEPLSNLDAKLRIDMRSEIKALHARLDTTIVYVTHDQVEAMTMADRVVVMNKGRIEQASDPLTLYEKPSNLFVASFIGMPSMNLLDGTLEAAGAGLVIRLVGGAVLPVPAAREASHRPLVGKPVVFGVRPEHVDAGSEDMLTIEVETLEPLGPHTLLIGRFAGKRIVAQVEAHRRPEPGAKVTLRPRLDLSHAFDPATGRRIGT